MTGKLIASPPADTRLHGLDLLRLLAVTLVLGRHMPDPPAHLVPWLRVPVEIWQRGGWIGVDLFFVLSGFLVSGLLFREYREHGRLDLPRFLVRRSLKIYPAFYACVGFEVIARAVSFGMPESYQVVAEIGFMQGYVQPLFNHTWSLAVEEHFYLALVLLLGWLVLRARPSPRGRAIGETDPFRPLVPLTAAVAVAALAWRAANVFLLGRDPSGNLFLTHLRIDSLLFGALVSYFFHFHNGAFVAMGRRFAPAMLLAGTLLFVPAFVATDERVLYTLGLTLFYLGGGLLVSALATLAPVSKRLARPITRLAACSYSVYLWHIPVKTWCLPAMLGAIGYPVPWLASVVLYVAMSLVVGVAMTILVERPMLLLRDRLCPSGRPPVREAPEAPFAFQPTPAL